MKNKIFEFIKSVFSLNICLKNYKYFAKISFNSIIHFANFIEKISKKSFENGKIFDNNFDLSYTIKVMFAQIAQSVEQGTENPRVGGSIPPLGTRKCGSGSVVEYRLAKARVAGSNPVFRSIWRHSQVVRQRSATPLSPVQIWVAPPNLSSLRTFFVPKFKEDYVNY